MEINNIIFNYLNSFSLKNVWSDVAIIFCAEHLIILLTITFVLYHLFKFFYPRPNERLLPLSTKAFQIIFVTLVSAFIIWSISQVINDIFPTPRPFLTLKDANILFESGAYDSFPSGHVVFMFTLALMSFFYSRKLFTSLLIGAFIIGIARVMAGVHWPIDIIGAFVLAFVGVAVIHVVILKSGISKYLR